MDLTVQIIQAVKTEHKDRVTELFGEYLTWANSMVIQHFNLSFDVREVLEQDL